jgi:hypothetical protein
MDKQQVKYPTIEAYLRVKGKAEETFKKIYDNLEKAIKDGIKATGAQDLPRPDQMRTPEGRKKYEDAMVKMLVAGAKEHFKIGYDIKDPINEMMVLSTYVRTDRLKIRNSLEKLQEQADLENMIKEFSDSLNDLRGRLFLSTIARLNDPKEVVKYTHTKGKVNIINLSGNQAIMAYLIDAYEKKGAVPDTLLKELGLLHEKNNKKLK